MEDKKIILSVNGLTKKYGDRVAVHNLNFSIKEGEIFGFLGSNGAGKSTTMKMITGIANATAGDIVICFVFTFNATFAIFVSLDDICIAPSPLYL